MLHSPHTMLVITACICVGGVPVQPAHVEQQQPAAAENRPSGINASVHGVAAVQTIATVNNSHCLAAMILRRLTFLTLPRGNAVDSACLLQPDSNPLAA